MRGERTVLYCSGWWELQVHRHLEKLFSENEQWWHIMWWTLKTEINYSLKQPGHLLFVMELGLHLGLEIVVMYILQAGNSSAFCYKRNSGAKLRYKLLIIQNPREAVLLVLGYIFTVRWKSESEPVRWNIRKFCFTVGNNELKTPSCQLT